MAEMSNGASQQFSEVNGLNLKAGYDYASAIREQAIIDSQRNSRGYASLELAVAHDTHTIRHLAALGLLQLTQTGATENQASVDPNRTGSGDYLAAGVVPANRATDVAAAGVATANEAVANALATAVALMNQATAALQAVLITAAGGASTPSQTQPKPTSAA